MPESEENRLTAAERKERIRERYKGVDADTIDVIPAIKTESFYEDVREKRVGVYARVSTDDPRQTSSYELQKNHYMDVISRHEGWKLIEIYADEGISGTSLQHRDSFKKMIRDCKEGKLDLIVTKSVSRFARNVLDCIGYVRELAAMHPPIGVFFETENIYTLDPNSEMSLSFISTLAQEESHNKSEIMNASIEMRFRRGIFLTPPLLGYDLDKEGNLIINQEEAKTVRLIFFMYLYGYTCCQIADTLTKLGRRTKKGNTRWSPGSILQQLQNERHCGDVLARKTWTPSYLNHKSKKNNHDRNQYRQRYHHEAIVSRDDFIAVQRLISNAKYGHKGILPELHVITEGVFYGYVAINPKWSGFRSDDYIKASDSVYNGDDPLPENQKVEMDEGDFDLRGFEIARSQFFDTANKVSVTFGYDEIRFGAECLRKLDDILYVEFLVHPTLMLFAVRPSTKNNKYAIRWSVLNDVSHHPRTIAGTAYMPALFELFGWRKDCKYRLRGFRKMNDTEKLLLFDVREPEVFLPNSEQNVNEDIQQKPANKSVRAFPEQWASDFGSEYYRHAQMAELAEFARSGEWKSLSPGEPYSENKLNTTDSDEIKENIRSIIIEMKEELSDNE